MYYMEKENVTFGDRLSTSFIMLVASFITGVIICCVIFFYGMAGGEVITIQFSFVIYITIAFALYGFVAPDRSMNTIGWIWKKLEYWVKVAKENDLN